MKGKQLFLITVVMLLIFTSFSVAPFSTKAASLNDSNLPEPIFRVENERIGNGYYTNLNEYIDQLKELEEGTIITRFRYTPGSSIMSLFSLGNRDQANGHFHLYISGGAIGSENRIQGGANIHVKTNNVSVQAESIHTLAMVVDKEKGYKYFLDGKLVGQDTTSQRVFLKNIQSPNSAQLGRTERPAGSNIYPFTGDFDFAEVYSEPLDDEFLLSLTGETAYEEKLNPIPEDALITDPYHVFYPGFMGSNNYRIPSLLYTKDGTLIAGIDRRVPHGGDSPNNIDAMVRRSLDNGNTWEKDGIIVNDYPDQASNIDSALLQDETNGRVFLLVTSFPHGGGLAGGFGNNAYRGTGYKEINGKKYMFLTDSAGKEYTIREEGVVYDSSGNPTNYMVDSKKNLNQNGQKINHIFSATTPLKPFKTSYLDLFYSDDEGKTWSAPIELNAQTKEDWMIFLGTGPGNGIQIKEGEHAGRLVFPVYFLNENNRQASAVIYSDDNGKTWHRGESPNEGRNVGNGQIIQEKNFTSTSHELTESQVVELPGGQLKLFMRNYSGYALSSTSLDGGVTWLPDVQTETKLVAPYSQMSAIRYNGQVDGKEAVIFASANSPSSRINGAVRIGLIEEAGTYENGMKKYNLNWKYQQQVNQGHYGYSNLTNLNDGNIGLHYEGTGDREMSFIKFNPSFLKWEKYAEPEAPQLQSFKLLNQDTSGYQPGDKIQVEAEFNEFVMMAGTKQLVGTIGDKEIVFDLIEQSGESKFLFEATIPETSLGIHEFDVTFNNNLDIFNIPGMSLDKNNESATFSTKVLIGVPATGVAMDQTDLTLTEDGEAVQLTAIIEPINATIKDVVWSSSNLEVATVSETGVVKPIKPGIAKISVTTVDGGFTDEITVTVVPGSGWVEMDGVWYYLDEYGMKVTGWLELEGKIYYLGTDGARHVGKHTIEGVSYDFDEGGVVKNGWIVKNGKRSYIAADGRKLVGFAKVEGQDYYFNNNGKMKIGWVKVKGKTYYFNPSGVMQKGWLVLKSKTYYLNADGSMQIGWAEIDGKRYYFNNKGVMQTSWVKIKEKKYYFMPTGELYQSS